MTDHDLLIEKLGREMRPVKPLRSTGRRVFAWLLLALPSGIAASFLVQRSVTDWAQPGALQAILQLVLAFVLGTLAIRSAFNMSIAGRRSISWKALLPIGLLWLGMSISQIPGEVPIEHDNDSARCFTFLLVVSTPMMVHRQPAPHPRTASGAQPGDGRLRRLLHGGDAAGVLPSGASASAGFCHASGGDSDDCGDDGAGGETLGDVEVSRVKGCNG